MVEARYIFVNKTAKSSTLSQSEGQERCRIMSHAQRSGSRMPGSFIMRTAEDLVITRTMRKGRAIESSRWKRTHLRSVALMPRPLFAPFDELVLPIAMSADMRRMLDYYISDIVAAIFPVASIANQARQYLLAYAGEDLEVLYAVLGVANASAYTISHNDKYAYDSERHQCEALGHIRRRLERGPTIKASTAFAVSQLLRIQCGQGNLETVKIHYDGLVRMSEILTTSSVSIPFPFLMGVQACMHLCAATLRTDPPAMASTSGRERAFDDTLCGYLEHEDISSKDNDTHHLSSVIDSDSVKDFVGEPLHEMISMSNRWRHALNRHIEEGRELLPERSTALMYQPMALEYRLLSLSYCSSSTDPLMSAREAIRLALYLLSVPPIPISEPRNAHRTSLAKQLKTALERSFIPGLWKPCTNLLLMVLAVAAQMSHGQVEWTWLIPQIALVCDALEIGDSWSLRKRLGHLGIPSARLGKLPEQIWLSVQDL